MMNNKDSIQRFLFETQSVRGEYVRLEESYQAIVQQHHYPPVIQKIIGEILVVTSLLSAILKFEGRISVQFQGKDKLKLLFAESDHEFHLRAYAQYSKAIDENELLDLFKQGVMVITMDPLEKGKRYQGIVNWQGNSIAESIEGYFRDSEQLATRLWVAVNDTQAAGMLLQILPQENKSEGLDESFNHLVHLTNTVSQQELLHLETEKLLNRLYSEEDVRLFKSHPVTFKCRCSQERSENALLILGRKEVELELKNNKEVIVTCEFCGKEYPFGSHDIARIFTIH